MFEDNDNADYNEFGEDEFASEALVEPEEAVVDLDPLFVNIVKVHSHPSGKGMKMLLVEVPADAGFTEGPCTLSQ